MSDGLCWYEEHEVILESDDLNVLAVRQHGSVEVWDMDGEKFYGSLPMHADKKAVLVAMSFYNNGFNTGERQGKEEIQSKFQDLIGISKK